MKRTLSEIFSAYLENKYINSIDAKFFVFFRLQKWGVLNFIRISSQYTQSAGFRWRFINRLIYVCGWRCFCTSFCTSCRTTYYYLYFIKSITAAAVKWRNKCSPLIFRTNIWKIMRNIQSHGTGECVFDIQNSTHSLIVLFRNCIFFFFMKRPANRVILFSVIVWRRRLVQTFLVFS